MIRTLGSIAMIAMLLLGAIPAMAQTPLAVDTLVAETTATTSFPDGIDLVATIDTPYDDIATIDLLFRQVGDVTVHLDTIDAAAIAPDGDGVRVSTTLQVGTAFVPVGIHLESWWRVTLVDGSSRESQAIEIPWIDDRFDWQPTANEWVTVHAYGLSPAFRQSVADTAAATAQRMTARYGIALTAPVDIWVYDSVDDFRGTVAANSREAVAGISYPGYRVIHLVLRDGDVRELGRTVTHEMAHQVLAESLGEIGRAPLWFDEGLATRSQTSGTDGYLPLAIYAADQGKLFSLASLDVSFPFIAADASIAYAISWSALSMIEDTWGDRAVADLIDAFAAGMPVTDALDTVLGTTIAGLDIALKEWLLDQSVA